MAISYIKLWKLLLDKKMKKTDLFTAANISTTTLARLSKDKPVSMEVMVRICNALSCDIGDIMEVLPDVPDNDEAANVRVIKNDG